jgi:hypothetical protein
MDEGEKDKESSPFSNRGVVNVEAWCAASSEQMGRSRSTQTMSVKRF